jgi:hypothetical protein
MAAKRYTLKWNRKDIVRLKPFYNYQKMLVLADETSKDSRNFLRRFGWISEKGKEYLAYCIMNNTRSIIPHII